MFGRLTSLAGMPLINVVSLGAGALFGGKSLRDEGGSRLQRRQAAAKAAVQRPIADFFLTFSKECRDVARQVHPALRGHFMSMGEELQEDLSAAVEHHLERFEGPLRIAVAGPAISGKSTLVNDIVGEEVAPVAGDVFTWYQDGQSPRAIGYPADGPGRELAGRGPSWQPPDPDVVEVMVDWPTRTLRHLTLVDTPADAGGPVREPDFATLAPLAAEPRTAMEDHLLSVDRFVDARFPVPLSTEIRAGLLDRFGLFGVRLATTLIRTGSASPSALSAE